jgi:hypothetical protein
MKVFSRPILSADDGRNGLVLPREPAPVLGEALLTGLGLEKILQHGVYEAGQGGLVFLGEPFQRLAELFRGSKTYHRVFGHGVLRIV